MQSSSDDFLLPKAPKTGRRTIGRIFNSLHDTTAQDSIAIQDTTNNSQLNISCIDPTLMTLPTQPPSPTALIQGTSTDTATAPKRTRTHPDFIKESPNGFKTFHIPNMATITHNLLTINVDITSSHFPNFHFWHFLDYLHELHMHTEIKVTAPATGRGNLDITTCQPVNLLKLIEHFLLLQFL